MAERAADPTSEALEAATVTIRDWYAAVKAGANGNQEAWHLAFARALDEFAQAAVEREREENAWLRRLLRWCHPRLKHGSYQVWLAKYLELGPSLAPEDEPPVVRSESKPVEDENLILRVGSRKGHDRAHRG